MKTIIKKIIGYFLRSLFGWNKTVADAYVRNIKSKIFHPQDSDEAFIVKEVFKNKNHGILIDVGAHTGSFFENFIWSNWDIYAFEPDPAEFKQQALREFQALKNIKVFNTAVSNESNKILPFYASDESTGISSLHSFTGNHKKITEVKTITLQDFLENHGIKEITILKIDTEGHDYFVLQGIPWDYVQPHFIMCEFEDRKTTPLGYDFDMLGSYLLKKGYKVFVSEWEPIVHYGQPCNWVGYKEYPCKLNHKDGWGNFLCFYQDAHIDYDILINAIKQ